VCAILELGSQSALSSVRRTCIFFSMLYDLKEVPCQHCFHYTARRTPVHFPLYALPHDECLWTVSRVHRPVPSSCLSTTTLVPCCVPFSAYTFVYSAPISLYELFYILYCPYASHHYSVLYVDVLQSTYAAYRALCLHVRS
jgi:hypothetical protein